MTGMHDGLDIDCGSCSGKRRVGKGAGGVLVSRTDTDLCPVCGLNAPPSSIVDLYEDRWSGAFAVTIEEAQSTERCWIMAAADYGSVPLFSAPAHGTTCDGRALTTLVVEMDVIDAEGYKKEHWDCVIAFPVIGSPGPGNRFPVEGGLWVNDFLTGRGMRNKIAAALGIIDG